MAPRSPFDGPPLGADPRPRRAFGPRRLALLLTGSLALALGVLGVLLPLLPATPFVLLAAGCYASAWPAMHRRLARSRLFGPMLAAGPEERYLPRAVKWGGIAFTCASIGTTLVVLRPAAWLCALLVAIALGVSAFLLWMPAGPRGPVSGPAPGRRSGS